MTRKGRRLAVIGAAGGVLALASGLVLFALRDSIVFFYGPTDLVEKMPPPGTRLRIGGLVEEGSIVRLGQSSLTFMVTDLKRDVKVSYTGLLPDLFREGQGVVAEGVLDAAGSFRADTILAKHDATYMPKDVADSLKRQGVWRGDQKAASASSGEVAKAIP
ncbi:cytochrome c maturation protein CcmE [Lichenihabitans sp. PAMC28606]|uniref:cytochrome c maturation protein CcmE n=1 Tax=Lichenihabitans sp. PAMC28606 TaxID=2880932 RepID=UPI001D0B3B0C|nr:cytochrome c maturation protein CcmE [Lichenihabitans sp. PAMC28606]UDL94922.1 cytochrome c maturation protein CcmE [Lichenihabitans sp. PAMC28606]